MYRSMDAKLDRVQAVVAKAKVRRQIPAAPSEGAQRPSAADQEQPCVIAIPRNARGHFLAGWRGGPGRPRGSQNTLSQAFLRGLHAEWKRSGRRALRELAQQSPVQYLKIMSQIMHALRDQD